MGSLKYDLTSVTNLIETEEHFENKAILLAEEIKKNNIWTVPIAVEINTNAIMDGHHRFNAAKILGLRRVPCVFLSYLKDEVFLRSWSKNEDITIDEFFEVIKQNKKFPPKTTRHIFNQKIKEINLPLDFLY
tara:strand:+ start:408 stop:803 length:396 start_codon:yes stop_codon:yes gene_type:complete